MPISQTGSYFENRQHCFLEESMLSLLAVKWNLSEMHFPVLRKKPTQILP